jgi:hypothetical protein
VPSLPACLPACSGSMGATTPGAEGDIRRQGAIQSYEVGVQCQHLHVNLVADTLQLAHDSSCNRHLSCERA